MIEKHGTEERTPLFCEQTHKLLARRDERGMYLWCRGCHREHFIAWEDIRESTQESELSSIQGK